MTIIKEDKLSISLDEEIPFLRLRQEVREALVNDGMLAKVNDEKMKQLRAGVDYNEFKDLVSTVNLRPFKRHHVRPKQGDLDTKT